MERDLLMIRLGRMAQGHPRIPRRFPTHQRVRGTAMRWLGADQERRFYLQNVYLVCFGLLTLQLVSKCDPRALELHLEDRSE